jgi:hypothetical protein
MFALAQFLHGGPFGSVAPGLVSVSRFGEWPPRHAPCGAGPPCAAADTV